MSDLELDPVAILDALGYPNPSLLKPILGGMDTAIWRVEIDDAAYALRVFRPEQAGTSRRELLAMESAAQHRIPVPHVYASTIWRNRPVLLLSWCSGSPLMANMRLNPRRIWRRGIAFGRTQARINRISAPQALQDARDWIGLAGPEEVELQARLRRLTARQNRLLHLDYHPLNIMIAGQRISCVLDWANAAAGDPRADYARTRTILRLAPLPPEAQGADTRLAIRILDVAWATGYRQVSGMLADMPIFYAWAGAMMANDLAPRLAIPGIWLKQSHLDRIRAWTRYWKQRSNAA